MLCLFSLLAAYALYQASYEDVPLTAEQRIPSRLAFILAVFKTAETEYIGKHKYEDQLWLPGSEQAGIVVYKIPEQVAQAITDGGVSYLNKVISGTQALRDSQWSQWQETPLMAQKGNSLQRETLSEVMDPVDMLGFVEMDHVLVQKILPLLRSAMAQKGSYYAQDGKGYLVAIPSQQKIIYFYQG